MSLSQRIYKKFWMQNEKKYLSAVALGFDIYNNQRVFLSNPL